MNRNSKETQMSVHTRRRVAQAGLAVTGLGLLTGGGFLVKSLAEGGITPDVPVIPTPVTDFQPDIYTIDDVAETFPALLQMVAKRKIKDSFQFTPNDGIPTNIINTMSRRVVDRGTFVSLYNFINGVTESGKKGKTFSYIDNSDQSHEFIVDHLDATSRTMFIVPESLHSPQIPVSQTGVSFDNSHKPTTAISCVFMSDDASYNTTKLGYGSFKQTAVEVLLQMTSVKAKKGTLSDHAAQEFFANGYSVALQARMFKLPYGKYLDQASHTTFTYTTVPGIQKNLVLSEEDYKAIPNFGALVSRTPDENVVFFRNAVPREEI